MNGVRALAGNWAPGRRGLALSSGARHLALSAWSSFLPCDSALVVASADAPMGTGKHRGRARLQLSARWLRRQQLLQLAVWLLYAQLLIHR